MQNCKKKNLYKESNCKEEKKDVDVRNKSRTGGLYKILKKIIPGDEGVFRKNFPAISRERK